MEASQVIAAIREKIKLLDGVETHTHVGLTLRVLESVFLQVHWEEDAKTNADTQPQEGE